MSLTDAGRRLHEYSRRILDLTAEARAAVTGAVGQVTGELCIAPPAPCPGSISCRTRWPHTVSLIRASRSAFRYRIRTQFCMKSNRVWRTWDSSAAPAVARTWSSADSPPTSW